MKLLLFFGKRIIQNIRWLPTLLPLGLVARVRGRKEREELVWEMRSRILGVYLARRKRGQVLGNLPVLVVVETRERVVR
jgi:hypothetical protein